jgi:GNAT superfamily N-acetyltransferase
VRVLHLYPVAPTDTPAFEALYALYARTIELSEQKTEAELRAAFAHPLYRFIVAADAGAIVGVSIVYLPLNADFWVLEYLAVAPSHEGKGLGGRLLAESAMAAGPRAGLIEVDSDIGEDAGAAKRRRRLRFYARAGCRRLGDINYLLPLRTHGAPPPMELLVLAPASISSVSMVEARNWLTRLYVEVYGQPADDPRIDVMLGRETGDIPLKPVGAPGGMLA